MNTTMTLNFNSHNLDRFITDNWGEGLFDREIPDTELDEQVCLRPGPRGCQMCEACANYADRVYEMSY